MNPEVRFIPEQASTAAPQVDALYLFLWAITAFFTLLIFVAVVFMGLRYRRRSAAPPPQVKTDLRLELLWTLIPFAIVMLIFFWSARVYFFIARAPAEKDALNLYVLGKQWMWKIQHPNGRREINEMHVPLGQPVRLTMASQDVIHSYYLPSFRVKQDVVPGRYTVIWFEATQLGEFHLFCAEYCGAQHSRMIGRVVVMEPEKYQAWLTGSPDVEAPADAGAKLFSQLGCITCHGVQAPSLAGIYGRPQKMRDGSSIIADEAYLRESILDSTSKVVAGYAPIMPSFRGQISEEQLMQLIVYIKSLKDPEQMQKVD